MVKLKVLERGNEHTEIELIAGEEYFVGRKDDCDIILDDHPGISRQHLKISHDGYSWSAEVLSHFGDVYFQGQVASNIPLSHGTQFELPPYTFVFEEEVEQVEEEEVEEKNQNQLDPSQGSSTNLPAMTNQQNNNFEQNQMNQQNMQQNNMMVPFGNQFPEEEEEEFDDEVTNPGVENVRPYLRIRRDVSKKEDILRLEGDYWVCGRDEGAEITLPDPKASRKHFELIRKDDGIYISDLGSANGTLVNGSRLQPKSPQKLNSGDIIAINKLTVFFEMRDPKFKEKLNEVSDDVVNSLPMVVGNGLPMNSPYNMPMMYNQMGGVIPMDEDAEDPNSVKGFYQKNKKLVILAVVGLLLLALFIPSEQEDQATDQSSETVQFEKLPEDQKRIVVETYKLAKNLYIKGNFELAAAQLEKLHAIIPSYQDSLQIAKYCENSRELKAQQQFIQERREKERAMKIYVRNVIANCAQLARTTTDIAQVETCLAPARENDPSNPEIDSIISEVQLRIDQKKMEQEKKAAYRARVQKGKVLYQSAEALKDERKWLAAIDAYEKHINSAYPDPNRLKEKSQRSIASIDRKLNKVLDKVMSTAQEKYGQGKLAKAILEAKKALKVDPNFYDAVNFIAKTKKELNSQLRNIYTDSVLEERFGNIDAAKEKWRKILDVDVPGGEYHQKAKRKLKQYGGV